VALVVQKYGGTSVGDLERIHKVAQRIAHYRKRGTGWRWWSRPWGTPPTS